MRIINNSETVNLLFWPLTFAYCLSLVTWQNQFTKLSIRLPFIHNSTDEYSHASQIYVTEILLIALFGLTLMTLNRLSIVAALKNSVLYSIMTILLIWGLIRAIPDMEESIFLVLRNSSFVWYLLFPLLISILPLSFNDFEKLATAVTTLSLLVLSWNFYSYLLSGSVEAIWIPWIGLLPYLWISVSSPNKWVRWACLCFVGIILGLDLSFKMQRTTWMGIPPFFFICIFFHLAPFKKICALGLCLALVTGATTWAYKSQIIPNSKVWHANPWVKAEMSAYGKEKFRWFMWKDAIHLALDNPLVGVGFKRQVVHRIYSGNGNFIPNNGNFEFLGAPPISGPHNSYLNALARIGLMGILYLFIHGWAFYALIRSKLYYCAWLLAGGALYAFFNVGLEGPTRSMLLLLMLAAAIRAEICSRKKIRSTISAAK